MATNRGGWRRHELELVRLITLGELADHGIDLATLRDIYARWRAGATKSELERDYLNAPQSHGKLFSALVREHLGVETEKRSGQSQRIDELEQEVRRLRQLLRDSQIDPDSPRP
jgi:hypothetical protein